jgi:hypothetical protein
MRILGVALAISIGVLASIAQGADRGTVAESAPLIEAYEPNVLGYTKQSDDVAFVDFTVSLKYQLFRDKLAELLGSRQKFYLTFTGRFGFYVRTRRSDPVIAKNYNPKFLYRFIPDTSASSQDPARATRHDVAKEYEEYIDLAYAHDSDGQTLDNPAALQVLRMTAQRADFALDNISRGWDYVQVAGKWTKKFDDLGSNRISVYPDFKLFLRHGLVEGVPEEYHTWEADRDGRPRHAFDGITVGAEYRPPRSPAAAA